MVRIKESLMSMVAYIPKKDVQVFFLSSKIMLGYIGHIELKL
jgi:nitrogen fixation protein